MIGGVAYLIDSTKHHRAIVAEAASRKRARELEVFSSIEPTRARKLLMGRKEPDAVRLLMEMEPGRVRKIVDSCKTTEEMDWARRILDQLHSLGDMRAGAEATGSSKAEPRGG